MFSPTSSHWLSYRRDYQKTLRRLFVTRHSNNDFQTQLTSMLMHPEQFRSNELVETSESNAEQSKEYLMTLFTLATDKQQRELIEQILEYREDIEAL